MEVLLFSPESLHLKCFDSLCRKLLIMFFFFDVQTRINQTDGLRKTNIRIIELIIHLLSQQKRRLFEKCFSELLRKKILFR